MNLTQEQKDAIAAAEQAKANSGGTGEGEATFTQEQVNKMIAERLARVKPSNDSLSAADIRMLKKENEQLKKENRIPAIKEAYAKAGGKDGKEFDDFVKLNDDLFEVQDLKKSMEVLSKEFKWAFGNRDNSANKNDGILNDWLGTQPDETFDGSKDAFNNALISHFKKK